MLSSLLLATTAIQAYPTFSRHLLNPILGRTIRYICYNLNQRQFTFKTMNSNLKRYCTTESENTYADTTASKKSKVSMDGFFSLSDFKKVSAAPFKGLSLVNIREYYQADGEEKPGKKGIALRVNQWNTLRDMIPTIDAHLLADNAEEFVQSIDEKTKVTVSNFKGKRLVQVREVYEAADTGETRFGSKGIALTVNEWRELCKHSEAIDATLASLTNTEKTSSSSNTAHATETDSKVSEDSFSLGNLRKVSVNMFRDKLLVNIREFYLKEGDVAELPGKKGIALTLQQWEELDKVRSQLQEGKSYPLGNKRRVTMSVFKGKKLYTLREFYDDNETGEEKPGSKGIALSESQWEQLNKHWDDINASIGKLVTP